MTKTSSPIVFFGSGPVAAESLRLLTQAFTIEAVVTKPRSPHHKGSVPVLELTEKLNVPVYTVSTKKELDTLIAAKPFAAPLGVLIDFGIIVSQEVIDYFPRGIINSHFSILPEWRGADPITFSILSGQAVTGVSLMLLTAGMDEGPLLAYGEQPLDEFEEPATTPVLTARLIQLSHALLLHEIPRYLAGEARSMPQDVTGRKVSYSRKLTKEDGNIDWRKPAAQLEREVRAFIEWPKSRAQLGPLEVIITKAYAAADTLSDKIGQPVVLDKKLAVPCGNGTLVIEKLKPAGKREMTGEAFLAGYKAQLGL